MNFTEKDLRALLAKNPSIATAHPELAQLAGSAAQKKSAPKYRNIKVYEYGDGFVSKGVNIEGHGKPTAIFDSLKEYERWNALKVYEKSGKISFLGRQEELVIQDAYEFNGEKIQKISYIADFIYILNGDIYVEDVKGYDKATGKFKTTKDFNLKWKLLKARYPEFHFVLF